MFGFTSKVKSSTPTIEANHCKELLQKATAETQAITIAIILITRWTADIAPLQAASTTVLSSLKQIKKK